MKKFKVTLTNGSFEIKMEIEARNSWEARTNATVEKNKGKRVKNWIAISAE